MIAPVFLLQQKFSEFVINKNETIQNSTLKLSYNVFFIIKMSLVLYN